MKIGFVFDDTLDSTDGIQQYILGLGEWLTAQGHVVHYLVGQTARTDIVGVHSLSRNVRVRFNGNRLSMPLPSARGPIKRLLEREKYVVLHVQVPYSPWMAHRVIMAAPTSTAIFGTFHIAPNSNVVRAASKALAIWTRRSLKRFDTIVSVSNAAAELARDTYGLKTDVLPNVVSISRFAAAQSFERYKNVKTIVYLGRLVPRKGCMLLLEAVSRLRTTDPDLALQVVICGRGPLEASLKAFAAKHGLMDHIEFKGFISEEDKPRFLASADVAVFPSSGGESFGIVLLEAMAAGRPVVLGANNPGYADVLSPYPDILFPVGDAPSLANKIRVFLQDNTERTNALLWQAEYVQNFDTEAVGKRLIAAYQAAIAEHNKQLGSVTTTMS